MAAKNIPDHQKERFQYLSTFLRELRFNNGLTQQELSENVGLHRNTIVHAENGYNLTILNLFELADFFDMDVCDLFQDVK